MKKRISKYDVRIFYDQKNDVLLTREFYCSVAGIDIYYWYNGTSSFRGSLKPKKLGNLTLISVEPENSWTYPIIFKRNLKMRKLKR